MQLSRCFFMHHSIDALQTDRLCLSERVFRLSENMKIIRDGRYKDNVLQGTLMLALD